MKHSIRIHSLISLLTPLLGGIVFFCSMAQGAQKSFLVVLDPGHGGNDFGTMYTQPNGKKIAEKEVTLALSTEIARALLAKGIKVSLTRTDDREIALAKRTSFANELKADLFVSVHVNSSATRGMSPDAEGPETFILNQSTDATTKRLAHFENSVLGGSPPPIDLPSSADATDVGLILKDLRLGANLPASKRAACLVQQALAKTMHRNRGVKQALFYVLLGADMPSILVESGFLVGNHDRPFLTTLAGQRTLAQAIAQAIQSFRLNHQEPVTCKVL